MSTDDPLQLAWAERFAARMVELGIHAELREMVLLGQELHPTSGHMAPEDAAQDEYNDWPAEDR